MKNCKRLGLPLRKIIEQFVERNHQISRRLDEQTKRIQSSDHMANKHCKRKALEAHCLVEKQIKLVREGTTKNQPKRKSSVGLSTFSVHNGQVHAVTPTRSKRCVPVKGGGTVNITQMPNYRKGRDSSTTLERLRSRFPADKPLAKS